MKLFSFFKRIKNGTVFDRIWEIRADKLSRNYKKQEKLQKRYGLYQIFNVTNRYNTELYLSYKYLKEKYADVLSEPLECDAPSEKSDIIWICWFQGISNAPEIVKACVRSVRHYFKDKEIILLNNDNIANYIDVPPFIKEKVGKEISLTHFSDIVRVMLLNKYGGLWIDATTLCTSANFYKEIEKEPLFAYSNVDMVRRGFNPIVAESWFIHSFSNQKILLLTQKLLFAYWQREKRLINYFLFHLFFSLATERFKKEWGVVPVFSEVPPNVMGFELGDKFDKKRWRQFLGMSDFHKLSYKWPHGDESDKETLYNRILNDEAIKNDD